MKSEQDPKDAERIVDPSSAEPVRRVDWLRNETGLRSGWRLLIYLLLILVLGAMVTVVAESLAKPAVAPPTPFALLMQDVLGFAVVFGAAVLLSRMERRPAGEYGLPLRGLLGGKFWLGFLMGIVEVSLLMGLISAFGGYSFGSWALHGMDRIGWGSLHLLLFLFVGLFEEFLFRGYTQFTLADGIGFWPAAILLSLGFGAIHLGNKGEGPVGAASVALVGLFFCFSLKRTGNLWYAVGLHASFDWGETFLFSVPNSGLVVEGHLSNSILHGSQWLTGGTVGPEGSVFCFLTMGLQFLVVAWCFPASKGTDANQLAAGRD